MKTPRIGLSSALIYAPISLAAAGIFFAVTVIGDYSWVTRIGGAVWILLLSLIISMPLATSFLKKRANRLEA